MATSTTTPKWNHEDLCLISRGLANTRDCSNPGEAKVFLSNRLLMELARSRTGHFQTSGYTRFKRSTKRILQARQLFGVQSAIWSSTKLCSECERVLVEWASERGQQRSVSLDTDAFTRLLKSNASQWEPVYHLSQELRSDGAFLILQGSYGDATTTPFSDVDFVLFGDLDSPNHIRLKNHLDEVVLKVDPLQHHGVFFYPHAMRSRYSESVLPIDTFENSTAICSDVHLTFDVLNDRYSPAATLKSFVNATRRFLQGNTSIRGLWDWKFKVSQFLLIPALLAATRGDYLYKGESFAEMEPLYSDPAWATINDLTHVRNVWTVPECDDNSSDYVSDMGRIYGRLEQDRWKVPAKLSLWKEPDFLSNASCFLTETLTLAGLA